MKVKSVEQKQVSKYYSKFGFTQYEKSQLYLFNHGHISIEGNEASHFTFYSQFLLIRTKTHQITISSTLHRLVKNLSVSFWFNRKWTHKGPFRN